MVASSRGCAARPGGADNVSAPAGLCSPTGAAAGNIVERFAFTNTSQTTCLLGGFPTITGRGPDGLMHLLRRRRSASGTFFGQLVRADIRPGRHAWLDLATNDVA